MPSTIISNCLIINDTERRGCVALRPLKGPVESWPEPT